MTKENLYNAIAIFLSIIGSFGVERIIEYRSEQNQIELLENNLISRIRTKLLFTYFSKGNFKFCN